MTDGDRERPQAVSFLAMAATAAVTFLAAAAWVLGPAALAIWRYRQDGLSLGTGLLAAIAAVWTTMFVAAAVRDRETRGWLVFGLFAWVLAIPYLVRALTRGRAGRR